MTYQIRTLEKVPDNRRVVEQATEIFFAASATQSFATAGVRDAFFERWLGRYISEYGDSFFVAFDRPGNLAGYLAGCPVALDADPAFADLDYLLPFARSSARYRAHLHINIRDGHRRRGIGSSLVAAFAAYCSVRSIGGIHAVTAANASNVAFYLKCGFQAVETAQVEGRELVFLGLGLSAPGSTDQVF